MRTKWISNYVEYRKQFSVFSKNVETITTERVELPLLLTSSRQVLAADHHRMFLHVLLHPKNLKKVRLILNFIFEICMFTCDCLLIEKNFVNTPTVN